MPQPASHHLLQETKQQRRRHLLWTIPGQLSLLLQQEPAFNH